jgi:uncharacterized protein YaeQ
MALPSTRYEYRIALADVARGVETETKVVAARHPSETAEHLVLRVLAYCLLYCEGLAFGPGLCDGDGSDLEARDGAGAVTIWVECGAVEAAKLRRVVQAHPGAAVHVVLADERRRRALLEGVAALPHGIKDAARVTLWQIAPALVVALAARDGLRQRWTVTIVEGALYADADGASYDGEITAEPLGE